MADQALATMGVKHPIVVRMMPGDNKHARAAAYANARQGLICLNPTDFSDTNYAWQYFALLHEASHIAHFDGTLAGKTLLVAHCEKRADTDALNAIDCKQCWSSIADYTHEEPSKKGYLSRTDIIAMMNKRTAWANTCSHHKADEDSAKRSSFMHTALTNLGKITLDLCLCAGASTLNACFLYATTSTSTKLVALVGWQALEELLKRYSQAL